MNSPSSAVMRSRVSRLKLDLIWGQDQDRSKPHKG